MDMYANRNGISKYLRKRFGQLKEIYNLESDFINEGFICDFNCAFCGLRNPINRENTYELGNGFSVWVTNYNTLVVHKTCDEDWAYCTKEIANFDYMDFETLLRILDITPWIHD